MSTFQYRVGKIMTPGFRLLLEMMSVDFSETDLFGDHLFTLTATEKQITQIDQYVETMSGRKADGPYVIFQNSVENMLNNRNVWWRVLARKMMAKRFEIKEA